MAINLREQINNYFSKFKVQVDKNDDRQAAAKNAAAKVARGVNTKIANVEKDVSVGLDKTDGKASSFKTFIEETYTKKEIGGLEKSAEELSGSSKNVQDLKSSLDTFENEYAELNKNQDLYVKALDKATSSCQAWNARPSANSLKSNAIKDATELNNLIKTLQSAYGKNFSAPMLAQYENCIVATNAILKDYAKHYNTVKNMVELAPEGDMIYFKTLKNSNGSAVGGSVPNGIICALKSNVSDPKILSLEDDNKKIAFTLGDSNSVKDEVMYNTCGGDGNYFKYEGNDFAKVISFSDNVSVDGVEETDKLDTAFKYFNRAAKRYYTETIRTATFAGELLDWLYGSGQDSLAPQLEVFIDILQDEYNVYGTLFGDMIQKNIIEQHLFTLETDQLEKYYGVESSLRLANSTVSEYEQRKSTTANTSYNKVYNFLRDSVVDEFIRNEDISSIYGTGLHEDELTNIKNKNGEEAGTTNSIKTLIDDKFEFETFDDMRFVFYKLTSSNIFEEYKREDQYITDQKIDLADLEKNINKSNIKIYDMVLHLLQQCKNVELIKHSAGGGNYKTLEGVYSTPLSSSENYFTDDEVKKPQETAVIDALKLLDLDAGSNSLVSLINKITQQETINKVEASKKTFDEYNQGISGTQTMAEKLQFIKEVSAKDEGGFGIVWNA